jgi:hypothetical protein
MGYAGPNRSSGDAGTAALGVSSGQRDGGLAGLLSGRPCDPRAFRRLYPDRWSAFLRTHFRNSIEIAAFFDVDEKTARQWLNGINAPQAWAVSFAVVSIPGAAIQLLEAA